MVISSLFLSSLLSGIKLRWLFILLSVFGEELGSYWMSYNVKLLWGIDRIFYFDYLDLSCWFYFYNNYILVINFLRLYLSDESTLELMFFCCSSNLFFSSNNWFFSLANLVFSVISLKFYCLSAYLSYCKILFCWPVYLNC